MATTKKGIYYPSDYSKMADIPADMKNMAESIEKAMISGGIEGTMVYTGSWQAGIKYPVGHVVYEKEQYWISLNGTVTSQYPSEHPECWKPLTNKLSNESGDVFATKKYVDDAISTAITDALGGSY